MTDQHNALITELEPVAPLPGPLHGKRLVVKDLIDVAGTRTTYGSRIYADHVPRATASAVERLVAAGAVVTAKANLHEFAWGVTSQNPWYGTVQNPRLPGRTTGGSSGGNAAALAAGLCELGLGTDTGCSIRLPASCCGVVGLKPSWGRVPVDGDGRLVRADDVVEQTRQVFANLAAVLAAAGATFADVVKVNVYLTDIADRVRINPVRQEIFGNVRPASTLVEVSALAVPGAKIEIEAVALLA